MHILGPLTIPDTYLILFYFIFLLVLLLYLLLHSSICFLILAIVDLELPFFFFLADSQFTPKIHQIIYILANINQINFEVQYLKLLCIFYHCLSFLSIST